MSIRNGINANHETFIPEDFRSEVRPLLIVARTQTCGARFILSHAKGEWWRISIITVMWLRVCSSFTVRSSGLSLMIGRDVNINGELERTYKSSPLLEEQQTYSKAFIRHRESLNYTKSHHDEVIYPLALVCHFGFGCQSHDSAIWISCCSKIWRQIFNRAYKRATIYE